MNKEYPIDQRPRDTRMFVRPHEARSFALGAKKQIRRVVDPQPAIDCDNIYHIGNGHDAVARICPFGKTGDRLWLLDPLLNLGSRLIGNTRIERLRDISRKDAQAEGCEGMSGDGDKNCITPEEEYLELWSREHTKPGETLGDNPYVWVLELSWD